MDFEINALSHRNFFIPIMTISDMDQLTVINYNTWLIDFYTWNFREMGEVKI